MRGRRDWAWLGRWWTTPGFCALVLLVAIWAYSFGSKIGAASVAGGLIIFGGLIFIFRKKLQAGYKPFTPWKEDFIASAMFSGLAVFGLLSAFTSISSKGIVAGVVVALLGAGLAFGTFLVGVGRWFEADLVGWAVSRLLAHLSGRGQTCHADVWIPEVGQVDFAVETRRGLAVVQVKSLERWKPRQDAAIAAAAEATALAEHLEPADLFIWLPRGRPSLLQRFRKPKVGTIKVIFGSEKRVVRPIQKLNKVQFKEAIPRMKR